MVNYCAPAGTPQLTLLTTLMGECSLEGLRRLQCMEGLVPLWEANLVSRLADLRCLLLPSCGLAALPSGKTATAPLCMQSPRHNSCILPELQDVCQTIAGAGSAMTHATLPSKQGFVVVMWHDKRSVNAALVLCSLGGPHWSEGAAGAEQSAVCLASRDWFPGQAPKADSRQQPDHIHPRYRLKMCAS